MGRQIAAHGGSSQDEPPSKACQLARLHGKRYGIRRCRSIKARAAADRLMTVSGAGGLLWLNSRPPQYMAAAWSVSQTLAGLPHAGQAIRPAYRPSETISRRV